MKKKKVLKILKELKESDNSISFIYTNGSCFRLYVIFKKIYKKTKPLYSDMDGHWIFKIKNNFFDINGEIDIKYIKSKKYKIIKDRNTLKSAYIPTCNNKLTVSYEKYK